MKKTMPIGIDDFGKLISGNFYLVDKTRFIKELLDRKTQVTLITRPRRFGKTLNLSMLKRFFSLHNAEDNRKLFNGLEIERFGEKYMKEQGFISNTQYVKSCILRVGSSMAPNWLREFMFKKVLRK